MAKKVFVLYKIYYGDALAYLGRTTQALNQRLHGHFFKHPNMREIDIRLVSKIEYAEFSSEADMYLYEIYFINKLKPPLNRDDKARDELTVDLPQVKFNPFDCALMEKWEKEVGEKDVVYHDAQDRVRKITEDISTLRSKYHKKKEMTEEEYWEKREILTQEKKQLQSFLSSTRQ